MNKEVAIELRRRLGIKGALRLEDITKPLGLSLKEVDSDGFDGALVRRASGAGGRILVKRNIRENTRKRFTAAHEIGHYLLHKDADSMSCGAKDIANWTNIEVNPEHEADEFASELLLPSAELRSHIGAQWPSLQLVSDLAREFDTSLMATIRKYCDVATQSCAGVWVEGARVRWFSPSPSFPHWIKVKEEVDAGLLECKRPLEEMVEVRAGDWIPALSEEVEATLLQGCVRMPTYQGFLVLLWANRPLQHRTAEDELLEELDSDRFDSYQRERWPGKK
ncbi:MAG TPA: ImmA/IrrE family metallo-endopeptidase [Terracidiphilus sp.]|nr:ImmA/IrrE family metallo-endopeptidase [Terracidiphilus sp.]